MDSPIGAPKATVWTSSGGALTRLRSIGAATPATTIPQAVALIAFDSRTGRAVYAARPRLLGHAGGCSGSDGRPDGRAREIGLGMPLHAEHEPTIGGPAPPLDRLGQLIQRRDAACHQ